MTVSHIIWEWRDVNYVCAGIEIRAKATPLANKLVFPLPHFALTRFLTLFQFCWVGLAVFEQTHNRTQGYFSIFLCLFHQHLRMNFFKNKIIMAPVSILTHHLSSTCSPSNEQEGVPWLCATQAPKYFKENHVKIIDELGLWQLTWPGFVSSSVMYSSNHSLIPPRATRTSPTARLEADTFAKMLSTSNFVSYIFSEFIVKNNKIW